MIESTEVNAFFQGIVKELSNREQPQFAEQNWEIVQFEETSGPSLKLSRYRFEVRNLFTEILAWSKNYLGFSFENDEAQISLFSTERNGIGH